MRFTYAGQDVKTGRIYYQIAGERAELSLSRDAPPHLLEACKSALGAINDALSHPDQHDDVMLIALRDQLQDAIHTANAEIS
jgi:hypothetical protein